MNRLTIITSRSGAVVGVRVNGQEIKTTHLTFAADATPGDFHRATLEFLVDSITTEPRGGHNAAEGER